MISMVLPYLLLVTFTAGGMQPSGAMQQFDLQKLEQINSFPYSGVAVPLVGLYDTSKHSEQDFEPSIQLIKLHAHKDIWPWVFMERFVGTPQQPAESLPKYARAEYYTRIKGMDIYNQTGALDDFFNLWRIALVVAKETGSPGIVLDHEVYGNPLAYDLDYVAREQGKSADEVERRLQEIGAKLSDIVDETYPGAVIWCLDTGLDRITPVRKLNPWAAPDYRTVTYVMEGLLKRAKEKHSQAIVVSGGEMSLYYCYQSLTDLRDSVRERNERLAPALASYPNLRAGAPISPWYDAKLRRGWMLKGKCGSSTLRTIDDFKPLISELLHSYNYVWVYAAGVAPYSPFDPENAAHYDPAIGDVMSSLRSTGTRQ